MPRTYTPEQIRGIHANRRARAAGLKYGYSYGDQGYTGEKESGASAYALGEFKKRFGALASPTWRTDVQNGVVMYKARSQNPDRVKDTGGDWFAAPDYVQRAYNNPERISFFAENPNATWQDFKIQQGGRRQIGTQNWTQDPATGNWVNPNSPGDIRAAGTYRRIDPVTGRPMSDDRGLTDWYGGGSAAGLRFDPATQSYAPQAPTTAATTVPQSSSGMSTPVGGGFAYHPPGSPIEGGLQNGDMGGQNSNMPPSVMTPDVMTPEQEAERARRKQPFYRGNPAMTLGSLAGMGV